MARTKRSADQLSAVAEEHLFYEISMLRNTAQLLATGRITDQVISCALLESFTIHLRVAIEFLWPSAPRSDDVIAEDYFTSPEAWASVAPEFPAVLEPARRRAGKEIAHLTYARLQVASSDKQWPFVAMANAAIEAMRVFVAHAPPKDLGRLAESLRGEAG